MIHSFIIEYGYWAILVGTFLEGETILILGGFAAHLGYLDLWGVILCAFAGSFSGDQLYFTLGRKHGPDILVRFPKYQLRVERVQSLLHRYHVPLILTFRFLYGLRIAAPFVIGMSPIRTSVYASLNLIGAGVWAITFGYAGYVFGQGLEVFMGRLKHVELEIMSGIVVVGIIIWTIYLIRRKTS